MATKPLVEHKKKYHHGDLRSQLVEAVSDGRQRSLDLLCGGDSPFHQPIPI